MLCYIMLCHIMLFYVMSWTLILMKALANSRCETCWLDTVQYWLRMGPFQLHLWTTEFSHSCMNEGIKFYITHIIMKRYGYNNI